MLWRVENFIPKTFEDISRFIIDVEHLVVILLISPIPTFGSLGIRVLFGCLQAVQFIIYFY